jgi:DNA-nicking Smr family endonuclease
MVAPMKTKHDDKELFERAMETLGVTGQPAKRAEKKKVAPKAAPLLPDDDLDFDALMRDGRGPAKLERAPAKVRKAGLDGASSGAIDGAGAARPEGGERAAGAVRPDRFGRIDNDAYLASEAERALFEQAMAGQVAAEPAVETETTARAKRVDRSPPRAARESLAEVFRKREIELDAQLDLHGKTKKEAERRVRLFLEESVRERWELVAIVCGRGVHSDGGEPVLKPAAERWLRDDLRAMVLEFREAPAWLGGSGTLVVRVRRDPTG